MTDGNIQSIWLDQTGFACPACEINDVNIEMYYAKENRLLRKPIYRLASMAFFCDHCKCWGVLRDLGFEKIAHSFGKDKGILKILSDLTGEEISKKDIIWDSRKIMVFISEERKQEYTGDLEKTINKKMKNKRV